MVYVSTLVQPLHYALLDLFIHLLQGFNHLQQQDMQIPEDSNQEAHLIFTGVYKETVQSYHTINVFIL